MNSSLMMKFNYTELLYMQLHSTTMCLPLERTI